VQGTVSAYDASTRSGRVLLDDGKELGFEGPALEGTGLLLLRPGQRVRLGTDGTWPDLRVHRVQIYTLP
jgi:2-phospho-L-lactate guanylyltransferase